MNNVLALDLETKNMSSDIGGFGNTHMFLVSTVTTWDGQFGKIYVDEEVDSLAKSNIEVRPLSQLKYDLDDHFEKGGKLLGHNIVAFDLAVLRDSMDIYCIRKYLSAKQYIDTSTEVVKSNGERLTLQNLIHHTLGENKLMESADAPVVWKQGDYHSVCKYCLSDSQLVYDLWKYGKENGIVKAFSLDKAEKIELEIEW
tara:strand:+ start:2039 stop:2635 length:597 start_codon:yes stop_codon:yes gene_type:complete